MNNEIYSISEAGIKAWDVFTKTGRYAGLIVTKKDGTLRHSQLAPCSFQYTTSTTPGFH